MNNKKRPTNLLDLPNEIFLEIFSFIPSPKFYLTFQLTCKTIHRPLTSQYGQFLVYQNIDKSNKLFFLKDVKDFSYKALVEMLKDIPPPEKVKYLAFLRLKDEIFKLGLAYDIRKGSIVLINENEIFKVERIRAVKERVRKKKFYRDKVIKCECIDWVSNKKKVLKLRGNDLVSICVKKNILKVKKYKVDCISNDNKMYLDNGMIVCSLPIGKFGITIKKVEEYVNIFLYKENLQLYVKLFEYEENSKKVYEIFDIVIEKKKNRGKKKKYF